MQKCSHVSKHNNLWNHWFWCLCCWLEARPGTILSYVAFNYTMNQKLQCLKSSKNARQVDCRGGGGGGEGSKKTKGKKKAFHMSERTSSWSESVSTLVKVPAGTARIILVSLSKGTLRYSQLMSDTWSSMQCHRNESKSAVASRTSQDSQLASTDNLGASSLHNLKTKSQAAR